MRRFQLHVLIERDAARTWTTHVLEFDLVAQGASKKEVLELLPGLLNTFFKAAEKKKVKNLFSPAPADCWNRFYAATPLKATSPAPHRNKLRRSSWMFEDLLLGADA